MWLRCLQQRKKNYALLKATKAIESGVYQYSLYQLPRVLVKYPGNGGSI